MKVDTPTSREPFQGHDVVRQSLSGSVWAAIQPPDESCLARRRSSDVTVWLFPLGVWSPSTSLTMADMLARDGLLRFASPLVLSGGRQPAA
jgi:hypothetical protein